MLFFKHCRDLGDKMSLKADHVSPVADIIAPYIECILGCQSPMISNVDHIRVIHELIIFAVKCLLLHMHEYFVRISAYLAFSLHVYLFFSYKRIDYRLSILFIAAHPCERQQNNSNTFLFLLPNMFGNRKQSVTRGSSWNVQSW